MKVARKFQKRQVMALIDEWLNMRAPKVLRILCIKAKDGKADAF